MFFHFVLGVSDSERGRIRWGKDVSYISFWGSRPGEGGENAGYRNSRLTVEMWEG